MKLGTMRPSSDFILGPKLLKMRATALSIKIDPYAIMGG